MIAAIVALLLLQADLDPVLGPAAVGPTVEAPRPTPRPLARPSQKRRQGTSPPTRSCSPHSND